MCDAVCVSVCVDQRSALLSVKTVCNGVYTARTHTLTQLLTQSHTATHTAQSFIRQRGGQGAIPGEAIALFAKRARKKNYHCHLAEQPGGNDTARKDNSLTNKKEEDKAVEEIEVVESTTCSCGAVNPGEPASCAECSQSLVFNWVGRIYKDVEEILTGE